MHEGGRSSAGCLALAGVVLILSGMVLAAVGVGGGAGLVRSDPQGIVLLAAALALVGFGLFLAATRLRQGG